MLLDLNPRLRRDRTVLADGTVLRIRPIRPDDKAALSAALRRLSPQSAQARFLAAKPRFSKAELAHLTEVDHVDHHAIVAVPPRRDDRIIAVARYVRRADDPATIEMAIVVDDAHQGLGLGRDLAMRLARHARRAGVRRVEAFTYADNRAAQRLLEIVTDGISTESEGFSVRHIVGDLAA
jgi:RimJ/RimL family protein N-acetyltransferase